MVAPIGSLAVEKLSPPLGRPQGLPLSSSLLLMAPPLFSVSAPDEYGVNHTLASFSSLEEAEAALSSLLSELEEASPSRASLLRSLASQLETELEEALA